MIKEETKQAIAIMQAYVNGKDIEYKSYDDDWRKTNDPNQNQLSTKYRIEPKEKYRAYNCIEEFLQAMKEHGPYIKNKSINNELSLIINIRINIDNQPVIIFDKIAKTAEELINESDI